MVMIMSGYPWLKLHHHVITMTVEIDAARLLLWLDAGENTWVVEPLSFFKKKKKKKKKRKEKEKGTYVYR